MSDVDRKIFAELADLSSGNLSNYIKRGKIILNSDGTIDTDFELNKIFLENRKRIKEEKGNPKPIPEPDPEKVVQDLPFLDEVMTEEEIPKPDIIKKAMIDIDYEFKKQNLKSKMILQVHDELIFDCLKAELESVTKIVTDKMENVIKLSVPLNVELSFGNDWYEAK